MTYAVSQLPAAARLVFLVMLCFMFALASEGRFRGRSIIVDDDYRFSPTLPPMWITIVFVIYLIGDLIAWRNSNGFIQFGLFVLQTAVWIAVFGAVLYFVIGPLRKRFNASACSMLWSVINFMYFHLFMSFARGLFRPVLRLKIAPEAIKWFSIGYLLIAAAVFVQGIVRHLVFRRRLLKNARPAEDPELTGRLDQIASDLSGRKMHIDLLVSGEISSPLSVGVFKRTTYVILPDTRYDYDEIDMIFRHEVIHILRMDPQTKLFMLFCCSLLWWDPLMWKGSELCSQDIELSCDEAVLYGADDDEKHRYAGLVIETASCDKGFTTCLSARAQTLRYRLRRIMEPAVDRSGIVLLTAAMLLVSLSSGLVSVETPAGTVGQTAVMQQAEGNELSVSFLTVHRNRAIVKRKELSEEENRRLIELLSDIEIVITEEPMNKEDLDLQVNLAYEGGWVRIKIEGERLYLAGGKLYSSDHLLNHPYRIADTEKVREIYSLLGVK